MRVWTGISLLFLVSTWVTVAQPANLSAQALVRGGSNLPSDFDSEGFSDLAVGVLFEDVDVAVDAGALNVLYGSNTDARE